MNPSNVVVQVGRIITEPTFIKNSKGEEFKAIFTIAVKRNYKNSDGMYDKDYFQVCALGAKRAKNIHRFQKGQSVTVTGCLESGSYEKNGIKTYFIQIMAEEVSWTPMTHHGEPLEGDSKKEITPQNIETDIEMEEEVFDIGLPFQ